MLSDRNSKGSNTGQAPYSNISGNAKGSLNRGVTNESEYDALDVKLPLIGAQQTGVQKGGSKANPGARTISRAAG